LRQTNKLRVALIAVWKPQPTNVRQTMNVKPIAADVYADDLLV